MFTFSRSSRWLKTKWVRDWCTNLFGRRWQRQAKVRSSYFLPHMGRLDDRTLLSVTFNISGDEISIFTVEQPDL